MFKLLQPAGVKCQAMGLLTNPQNRRKLVSVISKYNTVLSVLCYIVGLGWFLALAYRPLNAGTYFSENALLPGLVDSHFQNDHGASQYLNDLRNEVKSLRDNPETKVDGNKIPSGWFVKAFQDIGLEAYVQNFSFVYPEGILSGQRFQGQNVYGILRAPRGASTESLVLSAPYRSPDSPGERTGAGIALMLGLAKSCKKHSYWAKDIIFLVTEHEKLGMQAWLGAYHHYTNSYITAGELGGHAGAIQAAINLEIPQDSISKIHVKLEGLNGQLPNLDLVNTVVKLCKRENIPILLHRKTEHLNPQTWQGYEPALRNMLIMMWNQASGTPTGNHGLFHRFHVEAITLQGVKVKNARQSFGFREMGRMAEGVYRSLNNLLERFHQSFFFYLLPSTDRYVSIGLYMPPYALLLLPIVIKALALWISYSSRQTDKENQDAADEDKENQDTADEDRAGQKDTQSGDSSDLETKKELPRTSALGLIPVAILAGFFGVIAYSASRFFVDSAAAFHMSPHEGLGVGALAVTMTAILFPYMLNKQANKKETDVGIDWQLLKCISLLACGMALGGLSLMNISLAFFFTVVWVPVLIFIRPRTSRLLTVFQGFLHLLVSPISLLLAACMIQNAVELKTTEDPVELVMKSWETARQGLLVSMVDHYMLGSWMYSVCTLILFPIWLSFWALLWVQPYS